MSGRSIELNCFPLQVLLRDEHQDLTVLNIGGVGRSSQGHQLSSSGLYAGTSSIIEVGALPVLLLYTFPVQALAVTSYDSVGETSLFARNEGEVTVLEKWRRARRRGRRSRSGKQVLG